MKYRIQEGELTCDGEWMDQSAQILIPNGAPVSGSNLAITRDRLATNESFDSYINRQRNLILQTNASRIVGENSGKIDGRPGHFFDLIWINEGQLLHQTITLLLHGGNKVLAFSTTIPGSVDAKTRRRMLDAIQAFKFAKPEAV